MNEAFPRCAVPGSSCRLLQLEAPGARPVWAVLDAAGTRHFTGEITMHVVPPVRAWFNGGELYYAAREGDAPLSDRLVEMGVLTSDDLAAGSVQLGDVTHLGRLFDRVSHLDRDRVELALEILTGEVVGEIADHVVDDITVASYRHHPSGVVKWQKRPTVVISQVAATDDTLAAAAPSPTAVPASPASPATPAVTDVEPLPTAEDEEIVAEFEASLAEIALPETAPAEDVPAAVTAEAAPATAVPPSAPDPAFEVADVAPVAEPDLTEPDLAEPDVTEAHVAEAHVAQPDVAGELTEVPTTTVDPAPAELDPVAFPSPLAPPTDVPTAGPSQIPSGAPSFDLSFGDLRAELETELRAQFGSPAPVVEPSVPTDPAGETAAEVDADPSDEPAWAIDDRVEWQLDTADRTDGGVTVEPARQPDTAAADLPSGPTGGPVVEFDLQEILQQVQAETFGDDPRRPHDSGRVDDRTDADDDVRAAVRAALAEIEAATRSGGADEIPSILMQAALADTEPGLAAPTESWVQASLAHPDPAVTPALPAMPAMPTTPGMPTMPALPARPVLPGATSTPTAPVVADASAVPVPADVPGTPAAPEASSEDGRPADPPSQELPATGGLRRTIGFRRS